jgi:hypothetical protein
MKAAMRKGKKCYGVRFTKRKWLRLSCQRWELEIDGKGAVIGPSYPTVQDDSVRDHCLEVGQQIGAVESGSVAGCVCGDPSE